MIEHHIQKEILYKLVTNPSARFAELKPAGMDSNIFTYHLKQLISNKFVIKSTDGVYSLTPLGKTAGINVQLSSKEMLEQAHSIFLIVIRDDQGQWLLRRRLAHPMYGKWGFVHGEPSAHESLEGSANKALTERTGLTATYKPIGGGYVKVKRQGAIESFVHFVLLEGSNLKGNLLEVSGNGENKWIKDPDFSSPDMIPSMLDIVKALENDKHNIFLELEFTVTDDNG